MADTLDCSNSLKPCSCTAGQICIQVGRSGTQCAYNTCVDRGNSNGGGGGGKANIGALAGQAVGGVVGGLLVAVAAYWFWRRRRINRAAAAKRNKSRSKTKSTHHGNKGGVSPTTAEKSGGAGADNTDVTDPPGPGEEDARPVKRQSLRFDANNNPTTTSRRSLSGTLPFPPPILGGDNPFGDHHSLNGTIGHHSNASSPSIAAAAARGTASANTQEGERQPRDSTATASEFSFRSSHSTNIIPIAYIPAHSASKSIADLTTTNEAYGQQKADGNHGFRHSIAGSAASASGRSDLPRSSRLSVPFSLRSSGTGLGDSLSGTSIFNGRTPTFSGLFDRRTSSPGSSNGLEIIAASSNAPVSPPLTTPTLTRDGKPIRPPRAPGLDLKLPTPEPLSPPAVTSPGYPWNSSMSGTASPNTLMVPPHSAGGRSSHSNGTSAQARDTLAGGDPNARTSAYSTFSQTTGSTASHMSYILDPPQIVTPVSAGRVEVQVLGGRAAAKAVKLPPSSLSNSNSASSVSSPNPGLSPFPSSSGQSGLGLTSSPLSRSASNASTSSQARARANSASPVSDNPFDDEAAVRITMPGSAENTPVLPSTPTFGQSPLKATFASSNTNNYSNTSLNDQQRMSISSGMSARRDSDLSIFTSSEGHVYKSGTGRNSLSSLAGEQKPTSVHSTFAGGDHAQHGQQQPQRQHRDSDEVILEPPRRPFTMTSENGSNGGGDSRHTSAAMSMRSGYASVLDGIPFNLSMSPEARLSQASSAGGGDPSGNNSRRDTSYSLASEWNGAFAGMPIMMGGGPRGSTATTNTFNMAGGPNEEAAPVPQVPSQYRKDSQAGMNDDRYSSDSLAMAAAVARSFDDRD